MTQEEKKAIRNRAIEILNTDNDFMDNVEFANKILLGNRIADLFTTELNRRMEEVIGKIDQLEVNMVVMTVAKFSDQEKADIILDECHSLRQYIKSLLNEK